MRHLRLAVIAVLLAAMIVPAILPPSGEAAVGPALALLSSLGAARPAGKAAFLEEDFLRVADRQPLDAVLRSIGERFPGRALEARQIERDGRALYRIKWLGDDGKVRDVLADATTGEILRVR